MDAASEESAPGITETDRWWVHVPELSDAFQVEMTSGDPQRSLWWGNQVVGTAVRHLVTRDRWKATGRDDAPLPAPGTADTLYPTATAALIHARDAWRQRTVTVSHDLGEDYWIEPRTAASVDSLLGRIHLGHIRPSNDGTCEAFTTNNERLAHQPGERIFPTRQEGLLALQAAWRTHLKRLGSDGGSFP
ncbi:hypothetical protein ACFHW2_40160 [Actinomadura sp. LOL_016]|uniref:hypothetical protein n=1 Tax=unclassified Actinomadura TaxID=2626254 RepID=UPI003A811690